MFPGDKEIQTRRKWKKAKIGMEGNKTSPIRSVRRKLLEGLSPSQVEAGDQPRHEL